MDNTTEVCLKCGNPAGFEKSPEGDCCGICGEWVCRDCVDYSVSLKEYILSDGHVIAEDVICKECSERLNLGKMIPVREL